MSNQVYRDKDAAIPYNGEQYQTNIGLTGNLGGVGFIGVHFTRLCPFTIKMSVVSSQVGINWNGSTQLLSTNAIPFGFRPATEVWQYIPLLKPVSPVVPQLAIMLIDGSGLFTIRPVDASGAAPVGGIAASTTLGLFDIIWINNAIAP